VDRNRISRNDTRRRRKINGREKIFKEIIV